MNRDVPGVDWDPLWFRFTYRLVFEVTLISSVFRISALALRWATSLVHDEFMSFFTPVLMFALLALPSTIALNMMWEARNGMFKTRTTSLCMCSA